MAECSTELFENRAHSCSSSVTYPLPLPSCHSVLAVLHTTELFQIQTHTFSSSTVPDLQVAVLHGEMGKVVRANTLNDFRRGRVRALVVRRL